jgi:GDP-4-dehydro-6-deoxy-D-mannose reductase
MEDIVRMIEEQMGLKFEIEVDEALLRSTDVRVIAGDVSRLKADTGWVQKVPMEQTIAEMLAYWKRTL